ncbi:type II secretion system F family protein [bacterium]|nr:type II secretion system F family protein [bacterium]
MPDYSYIARELSGQQTVGVLTAGTEREAIGQLAARNLFPLEIKIAETHKAQEASKKGRVGGRVLAVFYTQLSDLLKAGVPLLRSLTILEKQAPNATLKAVVSEIRADVADGTRLAEALRKHPQIFSDLVISMIRAGEEGSFLEDSLTRIADFTEHQEDMKGRVIGAMIYPVILLTLGTIIVTVMMVKFVPQFEPTFAALRDAGELPWATTALVGFSDLIRYYGLFVLIGLIALGYFLNRYLKSDSGRYNFDRVWLKLYGVGSVTKTLGIARFCRVLGTLLRNGVPLLASLRIAKDAVGNRVLTEAIAEAAEHVSSGKSLARPLGDCKHFPNDVIEMIAVGEEANNLEQVLINVADKMERTTNRQLDLVVRLLEPAMLVVMAGVILFVVVALMLPILKTSQIA